MSLSRTTVTISQRLERLASAKPGGRGVLALLIVLTSLLALAALMMVLFKQPITPIIAVSGVAGSIVLFALMVTWHEWVFLLGMIAGHTIFYGKLGQTLGFRIRDSFGPSDVLFVLALFASLVYWAGAKDRPKLPHAIVWGPLALFAYTAGYIMIALFFWHRAEVALLQAVGWAYFPLALPAYTCLTAGRVWKPFFAILFCATLAGAFISTTLEVGKLSIIAEKTGYGGMAFRSFGDLSVKTNMLGTAVAVVLIATVVLGFSKTLFWRVLSLMGGVGGLWVIFLDRGRIHYAGIALALLVVLAFMPGAARLRSIFRYFVFGLVAILVVAAAGGETRDKVFDAAEKAWTRVQLTSSQALTADQGLTGREALQRQAMVIFHEHPIFGGGPGVQFGTEFHWDTLEVENKVFLDNSWAYALAVGGVVGFGLIMLCYLSMTWAVIVAYLKLRNPLHKCLALVPIGSFVFSLVCSRVTWWMVDRFHIAAFAIGVGMVLALVYHEKIHGSDVPVVQF